MLSALYARARFLAMPSIYEGFGFPVLEAMSRGTPALVSHNSSLPEICGDAAILVDPLDEVSISQGLIELIVGTKRDELALLARSQASKFTWNRAAAEMEALFREAMKDSSGQTST
jgi:glycosyltransferase involved in cell wall biosynthesis